MDVASLVLTPQHHDRFYQFLLEYQEISAHIQNLPFSANLVEFDPNVKVSCPYLLKCQNSQIVNKWNQIFKVHFFTVYIFTVHFTLFFFEGLS